MKMFYRSCCPATSKNFYENIGGGISFCITKQKLHPRCFLSTFKNLHR